VTLFFVEVRADDHGEPGQIWELAIEPIPVG